MTMYAKVDWYEFVWKTTDPIGGVGGLEWEHVIRTLRIAGIWDLLGIHASHTWDTFNGRGRWSVRYALDEAGLSISFSDKIAGIKVELSGAGCDYARSNGVLIPLMEKTAFVCSRIDLAADLELGQEDYIGLDKFIPDEFLSDEQTRKSFSQMHSVSGDTVYIGSWNSERFCRCYHFNEPHPRARLVRFEAVYRGTWAKRLLGEIGARDVQTLVKTAILPFKWKCPELEDLSSLSPEVYLPRSDKSSGARARWLVGVALPAVKAALKSGELNSQFVWDYLEVLYLPPAENK